MSKRRRETPPAALPEPASPPRWRRWGWAAVAVLVLCALALAALKVSAPPKTPPPPDTSGWEVPHPATPEMPSAVIAALDSARGAVIERPASAEAWGLLGANCDAHGLYELALVCYGRAMQLAPTEFRWAYLHAIVSDFSGAPGAEVAEAFRKAIALNPSHAPARYRFGAALSRQGDAASAREAYEEAIRLAPRFAVAERDLGQLLLQQGDVEGALVHLLRSAQLTPQDGATFAALARAYTLTGDKDRASQADASARTLKVEHGFPDSYRYAVEQLAMTQQAARKRATAAMNAGRMAEAVAALRIVVEASPEIAAGHSDLGRCLSKLGQVDEARAELERAVELDDGLISAHLELAILAEARKDFAMAAASYERALAHQPERVDLLVMRARALASGGDFPGALLSFEAASRIKALDAEALHDWGTVLLGLGRHAEAVERLSQSMVLRPEAAWTLYILGMAQAGAGRTAEAMNSYRRSAQLDPGGPASEALARMR